MLGAMGARRVCGQDPHRSRALRANAGVPCPPHRHTATAAPCTHTPPGAQWPLGGLAFPPSYADKGQAVHTGWSGAATSAYSSHPYTVRAQLGGVPRATAAIEPSLSRMAKAHP